MNRSLLALHRGPSPRVATAVCHLNRHSVRQPYRSWQADKGGEYGGEHFKAYCQETAITQQFAATNTPQQISVLECVGRTLCVMVRCMRVDSGLLQFLWGELMMTVSCICNRIPHSALNVETPYNNLYGKDDDLSHLKIIGARAFVHIKKKQGRPHAVERRGVRLQRDREQLLPHLEKTRCVVESRNVAFIEKPPNLLPAARRLSPQQDLGSLSYDSATTRSTTTTSRTATCCGTRRTTPPLWISSSTRLPKR